MRLLAAALLALGSLGCQLRIGVDIEVDRAGAGTLAVELGADEELLARAAEAGIDPLDRLAARVRAAGAPWRVEGPSPDPDGGQRVRASADFDDPEGLRALSEDLATALDAPEARLLQPFTATVTEEELRVSGGAGLTPGEAVTDYGLTVDDALLLIAENDAVAYDVSVQFPAAVLEAPGGRQETLADGGTRVTWAVPLGGDVAVAATGVRPGPPVWLLAASAGGGALLAGVVIVGVRAALRRRY